MELLHVQVHVNEWEFLYNKWYSYEKIEHAGLSSLFLKLAVYLQKQCNYRGNLEEDYPITTVFWNQKILKFFYKWINNIHESEGCFLRGRVGANSFNVFNSCIVDPWISQVWLQKKFENLLFS